MTSIRQAVTTLEELVVVPVAVRPVIWRVAGNFREKAAAVNGRQKLKRNRVLPGFLASVPEENRGAIIQQHLAEAI